MIKSLKKLTCLLGLLAVSGCQLAGFKAISDEPVSTQADEQQCECPAPVSSCRDTAQVTVVAPPKTKPCPVVDASQSQRQSMNNLIDELQVIGRVEYVWVMPDALKLKARIDTGAGLSSMHAQDLIVFERDGKPWARFSVEGLQKNKALIERPVKRYISIKQHTGGPQRRPVVSISLQLGEIEEQVEVTLTDRTDYLYPVLIGRNFLRDRAVVDVSKKFISNPPTLSFEQ